MSVSNHNVSWHPTAVVVGAGPVGCLSAMAMAKLGWDVTVYERRPDMRSTSYHTAYEKGNRQRSINLTISARGLTSIRAIDGNVAERLLPHAVPVRGRMVHHLQGKVESQQYDDRDGQCLYSIGRGLLNKVLLEEASSVKNIRICFSHHVQAIAFQRKTLRLRNTALDEDLEDHFDLCIGADGSHSAIRHHLMREIKMEYSQSYLSHEYIEIKMPPALDSSGNPKFPLDADHLHVWPRGDFTFVAFPNRDKSFTCSFFAPISVFNELACPDRLLRWFKSFFPDLLQMLGEKQVLREFENNPRSQLITTKTKPYHYQDSVILLGDSAHSMVPFYGQGLNCGLEDVRILYALLSEEGLAACDIMKPGGMSLETKLGRVLNRYSEDRHEDLVAICDLAMDHYEKVRHTVATRSYKIKRKIDSILYSMQKNDSTASSISLLSQVHYIGKSSGWIPLYTMVAFRPDISYSMAKTKSEQQERLLELWGLIIVVGLGIGCVAAAGQLLLFT